MTKIAFVCASLASFIVLSPWTPLHAQARTWVASNGSGILCTRSAPCADFQAAHNATSDGGEINCVDAGDFTPLDVTILTLSKSITIDCAGALGAQTFNNIHIANEGIVVRLRNLTIQGRGFGSVGVNFINGAALYIENCAIFGWQGGAGDGILFTPPAGVKAKLVVTDTSIENNGNSSVGGGIVIQPGSGAEADVTITRTQVNNNRVGIYAVGSGGTIKAVVRDSVVSGSPTWGIGVVGAKTSLFLETTTVSGNNNGLVSESSASMVVSHSSIVQNGTGLYKAGAGAIASYKNNNLNRNTADGTFTSTVTQQ